MGAAAASMPLSSSAREHELSLIETQRYRDFVKLTHTPFPRSHKNSRPLESWSSARWHSGKNASAVTKAGTEWRTPNDVMRFFIAHRSDSLISGGGVCRSQTF